MLFNSHIFMLLFLPLLLAGWYFLNWKKKFQLAQGYLIGMSLWFYAYANLQYLWLLLRLYQKQPRLFCIQRTGIRCDLCAFRTGYPLCRRSVKQRSGGQHQRRGCRN